MDNVFSGEFFEVNFFFKVEEKDQIIKKVTSLLRVKEGRIKVGDEIILMS